MMFKYKEKNNFLLKRKLFFPIGHGGENNYPLRRIFRSFTRGCEIGKLHSRKAIFPQQLPKDLFKDNPSHISHLTVDIVVRTNNYEVLVDLKKRALRMRIQQTSAIQGKRVHPI